MPEVSVGHKNAATRSKKKAVLFNVLITGTVSQRSQKTHNAGQGVPGLGKTSLTRTLCRTCAFDSPLFDTGDSNFQLSTKEMELDGSKTTVNMVEFNGYGSGEDNSRWILHVKRFNLQHFRNLLSYGSASSRASMTPFWRKRRR